jgi:hypothetical protein
MGVMPFFDGQAGRVYHRHWAAAQPRAALVFLHGFGEHTGLYHRYGAALNARDIDLWALDDGQEEVDLDPAGLSADPFYLDSLENDPLAFTGSGHDILNEAVHCEVAATVADFVLRVSQ